MTGALSPTAATLPGLQAIGSAVAPIDWYFIAMVNFNPDVEVPLAGSPQPVVFHLSAIAPATAAAVAAAGEHVDTWLQVAGPVHAEPGVRDALQHSLLAVLADAGASFATVTAQLQQLLGAIGPDGASPEQVAQAGADFGVLQGKVAEAAGAIAAAKQQFAGFCSTVLADVTSLQSGEGSLQAAIDSFGQWYVNALQHLQSSPLTIGADLKMLQDYAAAYHQSLATLQGELQQGIAEVGPAASAVLEVAEQWATLQQTTLHVEGQLAAASAQSLADDLTALDLASAATEWSTVQALAQSILTSMQAFPIPRQEGH